MSRFALAGILLCGAVLLETSCENADAVAQFASAATQALAQGPAVLSDIEESCVRERTERDPRDGLIPPNNDLIKTECKVFADQTPRLLSDSQALTNYFTAISQLASVGSTSAGKGATGSEQGSGSSSGGGGGGHKSAGGAKVSPAQTDLDAAKSIFTFLGNLAVNGYRSKHLDRDFKDHKGDVDVAIGALIT